MLTKSNILLSRIAKWALQVEAVEEVEDVEDLIGVAEDVEVVVDEEHQQLLLQVYFHFFLTVSSSVSGSYIDESWAR